MDDRFYLEFLDDWVPVEFMLALSPVAEHEVETEELSCPDYAIAYDVTTMLGDYGEIQIEECVIRDGDLDIYIWTVTNISFLKDGCGLCFFRIPNPGLPTVAHGELPPWIFTSLPGSWIWWLSGGSCGLQPGQSAVFMVAVPGPTIDTWITGNLGQCMPPAGIAPLLFRARTTGPGLPGDDIPDDECPDLVIRILDESCVYDVRSQAYELTVWAEVENISSEPVTSLFDVRLAGTSHPGNDTTTVLPPVLPGGTVPVTLSFTVPPEPTGGAPCPISYELRVDSGSVISECNELNNLVTGDVCCYGEPDNGEDCPDLTVEILSITCELDPRKVYEITVEARVSNIGTTTITAPIWVEADCDRGSDSNVIHTDLAPMASVDTEFSITFSVNQPGCPIEVTVEVDYLNFMVECNETNNTASGDACCN